MAVALAAAVALAVVVTVVVGIVAVITMLAGVEEDGDDVVTMGISC